MTHITYMKICLDLALKGKGMVAPNPMVGCVIVYKGSIIGQGFHEKYGAPHAEVNAIESVSDKSLLTKSTLYVNLEPCAHHGKTPPCSDLIIEKKIPHVVIGAIDTHSKVSGKGIDKLQRAGVHVEINILEKECLLLNKRFYKFHSHGIPFVILKWAQSMDGFISRTEEMIKKGASNWITGEKSQRFVHEQRATEQAILIGKNTAFIDNPSLTTRLVAGKNPLRVVVSNQPILDRSLTLFSDDHPTLNFNTTLSKKEGKKEWIRFDGNIKSILEELGKREIQSIIVEGGCKILNQFIQVNLWDEAYNFVGNVNFQKGIEAPKITLRKSKTHQLGSDQLNVYIKP